MMRERRGGGGGGDSLEGCEGRKELFFNAVDTGALPGTV